MNTNNPASEESSSSLAALPDMIRVSDVARRLGIAKKTAYDMLSRRALPFHRIGRLVRVRAADLASFITASRVEPRDPYQHARPRSH